MSPGKAFGVSDFRALRVWRAAQDLAIDTHRVAPRMRGVGSSNLRDQLVRAAMSVPTNIVEGSVHRSSLEFARYVRYSIASVSEVEGHLQLARDVGMVTEPDYSSLLVRVADVRKMLYGLLKKLDPPSDEAPKTRNG
jgi:four helix bundle protein